MAFDVSLGIYTGESPYNFDSATGMAYEHLFCSWITGVDYRGHSIYDLCTAIHANQNRWPFLTLEPWKDSAITSFGHNYLDDVRRGRYDHYLKKCLDQIRAYGGPILIRFMHEMNLTTYDWIGDHQNPGQWIDAYQRSITIMKSYLHGLKDKYFVWGPDGGPGSDLFYPGPGFCDFMGCATYSWSLYNSAYLSDGSFASILHDRTGRIGHFPKPLIVAECGVEAGDDQQSWWTAAKASFSDPAFGALWSVIYFNSHDSYTWTPGGPHANWSIPPSIFHL